MTMTLIETKTLGTAQASIEFTSIPQDGTDLVVMFSLRTASGTLGTYGLYMEINGLTTNRTQRRLYGTGSGVGSDTPANDYLGAALNTPDTTSNTFTSGSIYIPNYAASQAKSFSLDSVVENNATATELDLVAGLWNSTAAITALKFLPTAGNLVVGSQISLYKITKGSSGGVVVS